MTTAAIVTTVIMCLVFIVGLVFCFGRIGRGGTWKD
jgi:hypothetical protein